MSRLPCVVLMASDRALALSLVRVRIKALGCAFVTTTNLSERGPSVQHSRKKEHGEHVGVGAMRDLFMLSLVDVFLGTERSTFSYLAGNLLSSPSRGPILGAHNSPELKFCSMSHQTFECGRLDSLASRADDPPTLLVKPVFRSRPQRLNDSAFCAAYGVLPATPGALPPRNSSLTFSRLGKPNRGRLAMAYAAKPFAGAIVWHNKTVCIAAPPTQYTDHNSSAADLWCVPRTDHFSTNIRAVVVFPLNGRPWDSDFHPYHDAMRLWWLLEFAQLLQNGRG